MTTFFIRKKKSVVIMLKKTETLYSAVPPRTMISKMLIGLICEEGCPSLLGRNRSAAVCLSVYPLCHLCRRFSVFCAFKRLLLAEARYPSGCRAAQTLGEPMAPLNLLGVLPLISAENFCQSSQSKEKAKSFRWLSGDLYLHQIARSLPDPYD